jgi:pimeloyl-ACP methyl ester carboxylesterase
MTTPERNRGLVVDSEFARSVLCGLALVAAGCGSKVIMATPPDLAATPAPYFVLVHGAWMGAWAFADVAAGLRAKGATAVTVELPAHGADQTAVTAVSLDSYVAKVTAAVDAADRPVILVGHSFGGVVITAAGEARPSRIAKLIYLAALVPADGQSAQGVGASDTGSHSASAIQVNLAAGTVGLPMDQLEDIFCADCSASALATLKANYRDEPLGPLATAIHTTAANWGSLKKSYIYTKQDFAVSYGFQKTMTASGSWVETATLDTSHAPFLSMPSAVVDLLAGFAQP